MTETSDFSREDLDILLPIFRASTGEQIASVRQALQTLRRAPDDAEALVVLHRAVHSIKGASLQLGFVHIGVLARAMEGLAVASRERAAGVPSECAALFASGADLLERYLEALDRPSECPNADGALLNQIVAMTERKTAEAAGTGRAGTP